MVKERWTCPYCDRDNVLDDENTKICQGETNLSDDLGTVRGIYKFTICPNPNCRKTTIKGQIHRLDRTEESDPEKLYEWQLVPESNAKQFPEYIPQKLREDYYEACLLREKSPKASATLSRRCLRGTIHDYWRITKTTLADEMAELQTVVDKTTWDAIDSVRSLGNIGVHMHLDVNAIVEVDADEPDLLIYLIEKFFTEWYMKDEDDY